MSTESQLLSRKSDAEPISGEVLRSLALKIEEPESDRIDHFSDENSRTQSVGCVEAEHSMSKAMLEYAAAKSAYDWVTLTRAQSASLTFDSRFSVSRRVFDVNPFAQ